jgi:hypothetical protein
LAHFFLGLDADSPDSPRCQRSGIGLAVGPENREKLRKDGPPRRPGRPESSQRCATRIGVLGRKRNAQGFNRPRVGDADLGERR